MRCYFSSEKPGPGESPGPGLVSFAIPELKISFRARYHGTAATCEYAGLLALLEFVEINPTVFQGVVLEIFGDSITVIGQVNDQLLCRKELEPFRHTAQALKLRIPYTLDWIPRGENPAVANSIL